MKYLVIISLDIYYIELAVFLKRPAQDFSGRPFYIQEEKMELFCSEQIRKLAQALIKVQKQLQPVTKDANGIPLQLTWSQTIHYASLMGKLCSS